MNIQDYIEHFDNTFNTNISENTDINNFPMLQMIFKNMAEYFYKTSQKQENFTVILSPLEKKLMDSLTEKQQEIFDKYLETETISKSELAKQMLVFGYLLAYQELKEMDALK